MPIDTSSQRVERRQLSEAPPLRDESGLGIQDSFFISFCVSDLDLEP